MSEGPPHDTDSNSRWTNRSLYRTAPTVLIVGVVVGASAISGLGSVTAMTAAPTQIDSCTTISSSGTYTLAGDVRTNETGDCIRVTAPDVVLDGANHTLTGTWEEGDSSYSAGVNVTARNVTVEHLTVTNFARGVTASSEADAVTVSDVAVEHAWFGVLLGWRQGTDDGLVTDTLMDDVRVGVRISSFGANNTISGTTVGRAWQDSLLLRAGAHDNVIRGNNVTDVTLKRASANRLVDNTLGGVWIDEADGNEVIGNVVDGPGIDIGNGADANTVRDNVVRGGVDAIHVRESSGNTIVDNTVLDSTDWGIHIDSAPETTVRSNRVRGHPIGIQVLGRGPVRIANNSVVNSSDTGIRLGNAADVAVVGNEVRNVSDPDIPEWRSETIGLRIRDSESVVVRDNDVSVTRNGVSVEGSSDVRVLGNRVTDASFHGIEIYEATNVTVADSELRRNLAGIHGQFSTALRFANNTIENGTSSGTTVYHSRGVTIRDSRIVDNKYHGIRVRNVTDAVVDGVVVSDHWRIGIRMGTLTDVTVRNAESTSNGNGIRARRAENLTLVNSTATGNQGYGILVRYAENATLRGNAVRMNNYGFRLADVANSTMTDTTATDHENAGVYVERSTDTRLENVTSRSNDAGAGIRLDDVDRTAVARSEAADNSYGVRLHGSRETVLRNVSATGNRYEGIRLFETTDATVEESRASDNRFGLKFVATSDTTVADTTATGNDWAGIRFSDDSWKGRGSGPTTGNRLVNVTVRENGLTGVRLVSTTGTVVRNTSVVGNDAPGLWLSGTNGTRLERVNFSGNAGQFTVLAADGATVERARNVSLGDGTVGFEGTDFTLDTVEAQYRPADPDGYANVSRHVRVTPTSSDPSLELSVDYTDQAVEDAGVDEGTLRLWSYDGSWSRHEDENTVNTMTNTVSATIRNFGIIAPLGEQTNETNTSENEVRPVVGGQGVTG